MSDIRTDHYPDLAQDELWDIQDELRGSRLDPEIINDQEAQRSIRRELIRVADALDASNWVGGFK